MIQSLRRYKNELIIGDFDVIKEYVEKQVRFRNETFAFRTARVGKTITTGGKQFIETLFRNNMRLLSDDYDVHYDFFLVMFGSYIDQPLNEFILQCQQHGIIKYFEFVNIRPPNAAPKAGAPRKVLTTYILSAGLYLWLASVAVACVVFVLEHVVDYFTWDML